MILEIDIIPPTLGKEDKVVLFGFDDDAFIFAQGGLTNIYKQGQAKKRPYPHSKENPMLLSPKGIEKGEKQDYQIKVESQAFKAGGQGFAEKKVGY